MSQQHERTGGHPLGPLYTWWRGDPLTLISPLPGWATAQAEDIPTLATLNQITPDEVRTRLRERHVPYIGRLGDDLVAYGWSATSTASIGGLGLTFTIPPGHRYLWDFATLPAWRNRGLYAQLLQAILTTETSAERFWIGHDARNVASGRGMVTAGFRRVGDIWALPGGTLGLAPHGPPERSSAGAAVLGLRLLL